MKLPRVLFSIMRIHTIKILCFVGCNIFSYSLFAADTSLVNILNSNSLNILTIDGKEVKKLIGQVKIQHNETIMDCDVAIIDEFNNVDAQGNIVIHKGATVTIHGNSLYYQSKEKFATLKGNVRLKDSKMTLQTNELFYDMNKDIGYYNNKGLVTSQDNKIRSNKGTYFANAKDIFFKDEVTVVNPKFKLKSDTLKYNSETEIATFYGGTQIYNDSSTIWCKTGWYNTKTNISAFGANTIILSSPQWIRTDSLYYDKNIGYGKVLKNYDYHDTSLHITLEGNLADYYDKINKVIGYNRPLLTYEQEDKNHLYLRADTLITLEENNVKSFFGYKNVRLFKNDFQAVCDTLLYSMADSTFKLYNKPIVWNDSTQLKADTIFLFTKNKKPFKADLYQNAMVAEHIQSYAFNQMTGKYIYIYFKDGKTDFLNAIYEAKCKYYGKEEGKGYQGLNTAEADEIKGFFVKGKMNRIQFLGNPKAVFTPIKKLNSSHYYLLNFEWKDVLRPKSKNNL